MRAFIARNKKTRDRHVVLAITPDQKWLVAQLEKHDPKTHSAEHSKRISEVSTAELINNYEYMNLAGGLDQL